MSEASSQVSVVEKPEVPAKKPSLRQKLVVRFKLGDQTSRQILEKLSEDPRLESEQPQEQIEATETVENEAKTPDVINAGEKSPEVATAFTPLDPEIEYKKALSQTKSSKPSFDLSETLDNRPEKPLIDSQETRIFNIKDKARHKLLELEARRQGVKDIEGFNRLVAYFETKFKAEESYHPKYKANITDEDKDKIIQSLKSKGYGRVYFDREPEDGKIELNAYKDIPFNVQRDNIQVINALLETGVDSIPFLDAIGSNARLDSSFLNQYNLERNTYSKTAKVLELLKTPGAENVLPLIRGMSIIPHQNWDLHRSYDDTKIQLDQLQELAESGNIPVYPPEFFDKVSILAKSLKRGVDISELPNYEELLNNPNMLSFLSTAIEKGFFPRTLEDLNTLEKDNLFEPLKILMQNGVIIDQPIFGGYEKVYGTPVTPQEEVNQKLLELINEPSVQAILTEPDRQDFARVLREMNGGADVSAEINAELFDKRKDLVALNNLIFPSLDTKYDTGSYFTRNEKLNTLKDLLGNDDERRKMLLSPDFQKFIQKLREDHKTDIQPQDFFKYARDAFDFREHADRYETVLVQLYKYQEITDIIDPDIPKKIIEGLRANYQGDINPYSEMHKLKDFSHYTDTIKWLRQNNIPLDPENFKDANWIASVQQMPLLRYDFRDKIPPERINEWMNAALKLPHEMQKGLQYSFQDKDYKIIIDNTCIERVRALADIVSSSDFFPKNQFTSDWKFQTLYSAIGAYEGDPYFLFTDGRPNGELAKLLINLKQPGALALVLDEKSAGAFHGNERITLKTWMDLPQQLQILSSLEPGFPDFQPEFVHRYKVAASIMNFAGLDNLDNDLLKKIIYAHNYRDYLTDGKPSKIFIEEIIKRKNWQNLPLFLNDDVLTQYDDVERSVLVVWKSLPDDLKTEVINDAPNFPNVLPEQLEKYRVAAETIGRIRNSPSAEIKRLEKELIGQLWKLENPKQALEEIIGIFEKNNLPPVGKIYRVFETIYDNPNTPGGTILERDLSTRGNLSPELKSATPRQRREMIYKDLLSVNINSANPELRDYLEVIRDGEEAVGKLEAEGIAALIEREQDQLKHFFDKMDMLYSSSLFGRTIENRRRARHIDSIPSTAGMNSEERLKALRRNFRVKEDQHLSDRLSEMFLRPVGFNNIEEVLVEMDRVKMEADVRNREFVREGIVTLKAGDRFKGIQSNILGKILDSGAVAREYLGSSAGSDATPYDSDTGLILEQDLSNGVKSAIHSSPSISYGNVLLVVRDRGQFGIAPNQYESFQSGSASHYGIRTGFPSSEIDAIIAMNILSTDDLQLDNLFIRIAQHGQYIPVSTDDGTVIFSPEKFDEYRKTFDGVSEYSATSMEIRRVGVDEGKYNFPEIPQIVASTRATLDQMANDIKTDRGKVQELSNQISTRISQTLATLGVNLRGEFDTSIYGAQLVDTGSTSRGSNLPGDYDFDLSLQLDPNDTKRLTEISGVIKNALQLQEDKSHNETDYVQVRAIGSQIIEGETLDIDIGIGKRSDEGIFASSDAVGQKLESIRSNLGDEVYYDVLGNIVLAKKVLKEGHAYKKLEDGGMGGIGVENWILRNNGNVLDAFQSFWSASHDAEGGVLSYEDFAKKYKIFDAGTNIKFNIHDNFIRILKTNGYSAMIDAIGGYLGYS